MDLLSFFHELSGRIPGGLAWALLAGAVAAALAAYLSQPNPILYWVDQPNHRSLHERPTPRTGGVAVLMALLCCGVGVGAFSVFPGLAWLAIASLATLGLMDDRHSLSVRARWPLQILAFALMVVSLVAPEVFDLETCAWLALLWIAGVWFLNLFNFMDGMDGFAGSMTVIGAGALALHAQRSAHALAPLAIWLMCAAVGFLSLNWPRAKIFLGDAGAYGIAALLFALSLKLLQDAVVTVPVLLLIFLPFWGDATLTLCKRVLRRERFWEAHRSHYYQRAVRHGWPVWRVLLCEIATMLLMAAASFVVVENSAREQWLILGGAVLLHLLVFAGLSRIFAKAKAGKAGR